MKRRLYNIAVVTSLVMFVAVMGLWVASGFCTTVWSTDNPSHGGVFFIAQTEGAISAGWARRLAAEPGLTFEDGGSFSMLPPAQYTGTNSWFGLGYLSEVDGQIVFIPHWLLAILTLILPVVWLIRRRKRDPDAVPCSNCGYDLRGSPSGACPECGAG